MENFERLENKIDVLTDKVTANAIATTENTCSLVQHMEQTVEVRKQTELLFQGLKDMKEQHSSDIAKIDAKIAPLTTYIDRFIFLGKTIVLVCSILIGADKIGLIDVILKIYRH